ncbi:16S rRNA (guanine(527)-N(7))-methyltransferase RsmG [Ferribacterium limneticum]|uniref:16S rRNA (guanine(527)-N(7))-methyltransferase RsmG n=1 Tax=Ferribacterium limneticum TaxID=76259 RepID=UPI001CFBA50B|nr:16S rRNA (guanine(527)-N(7))-methyltransferase RsmG [Ferribacterium limneticum]UCV28430.1 16S rRNA (guanine(527)-N(7))-methyltransferase RsmG [Ferribacterium limneticum]UCV32347.1 16S rRNA (guanine(527)-N(7))-methyltransferase RsmG [Ferribacterium limneticum]
MSQNALAAGLAALDITLPADGQHKLLAFRDLLLKWNKTYNLTALRDPALAISHHLLDSLAILPHVGTGNLLDVGSGGGLPGIPLAIARPDLSVSMVDTVQKKTTFLQQAVIELALKNVTVHHARVEEMQGQYAQISSRAFAEIGLFISLTRHLLAPNGRWLAMKGVRPDDELKALPADIMVEAIIPLTVPGLDAERHLIILKAGS